MSSDYCLAPKYWMCHPGATCGEPVTGSHDGQDLCEMHLRRAQLEIDLSQMEAAKFTNNADFIQQQGHFLSPEKWAEACRLFRNRCSAYDCEQMARMRTYIEEGLLVLVRPSTTSELLGALRGLRDLCEQAGMPCERANALLADSQTQRGTEP